MTLPGALVVRGYPISGERR